MIGASRLIALLSGHQVFRIEMVFEGFEVEICIRNDGLLVEICNYTFAFSKSARDKGMEGAGSEKERERGKK